MDFLERSEMAIFEQRKSRQRRNQQPENFNIGMDFKKV